MKNVNSLLIPKTLILTLLLLLSCFYYAAASTFTAVASGNWSVGSTWQGGVSPGNTISADAITIPTGIVVTLDIDATISGALSNIDVEGTLNSTNTTLTFGSGSTLSGAGTIGLDNLNFNAGSASTFTGTSTISSLATAVSLNWASGTTISQTLNLSGGTLTLATGGSLSLLSGATVTLSGGTLLVSGGILSLTNSYNVVYSTVSQTTGVELTGTGLNNVMVSIQSGNTLTLLANQTVNGTFTLGSGTLVLNGFSLTLNGQVIDTDGYINSTNLSSITINNSSGASGTLHFTSGSVINNLSITAGTPNIVSVDSLTINGTLALNSGTLYFNELILNGALTGSGMFASANTASLIITNATGLSNPVNFATGQTLGLLLINVGSGNTVTLGTALTIDSIQFAGSSELDISNVTITVTGNITGIGSFKTNSSTGLVINSTNSIAAPIVLNGSGIDSLIINLGTDNTVTLGSNIDIASLLDIETGTLVLNGYDFSLTGTSSGQGTISSTSASNITLAVHGNNVNFTTNSQANNVNINLGTGNTVLISNLGIYGTLALNSGTLYFSSLTINGQITGSGYLSCNGYASLTISTPSGLTSPVNFAANSNSIGTFTVACDSGKSVTLGSNLSVSYGIQLSNGSILNISNDTITLNGTYVGTGKFVTNSSTELVINGLGFPTPLKISGNVGAFDLNIGAGNNVTLGDSLHVTNLLELQSGALVTNGNDIILTGNIAANDSGYIAGDSTSNVIVNVIDSLSGGLAFSTGASIVHNLWVSTPAGLNIETNLTVLDSLTLSGGTVNIENDTLTIGLGGILAGADSSSYIIATDSGALAITLTTGDTGWTTFYIGTDSNYLPIALQLNSNSTSGMFYASVNNNVYAQGTNGAVISDTQAVVNATWHIEPAFAAAISANMRTSWSSALQVNGFNTDSAYIAHYTGGQWDFSATEHATAQAGSYYWLQRDSITSFSPFAVFSKTATVDTIPVDTNPSGINQVVAAQVFEVYPNPVAQNLIIDNINRADNIWVDVITLTGQVIARYQLVDYSTTLDVTNLSAGNYFIKLYNSNNSINEIKPFVKM